MSIPATNPAAAVKTVAFSLPPTEIEPAAAPVDRFEGSDKSSDSDSDDGCCDTEPAPQTLLARAQDVALEARDFVLRGVSRALDVAHQVGHDIKETLGALWGML